MKESEVVSSIVRLAKELLFRAHVAVEDEWVEAQLRGAISEYENMPRAPRTAVSLAAEPYVRVRASYFARGAGIIELDAARKALDAALAGENKTDG